MRRFASLQSEFAICLQIKLNARSAQIANPARDGRVSQPRPQGGAPRDDPQVPRGQAGARLAAVLAEEGPVAGPAGPVAGLVRSPGISAKTGVGVLEQTSGVGGKDREVGGAQHMLLGYH